VPLSIDISGLYAQNARLTGHLARVQNPEEQSVANTKQSAKRARQGEKRRQHNVGLRSRMRTAIKNVLKAAETGNAEEATTLYKVAVPKIDTMVNKGLIHKNKAARTKSRLNAKIRTVGA
jgi:small subunit ribosomal protein S20